MEEALHSITETKWPLPSMPDITKFDFILNITSVDRLKRGRSCLADMKQIKTLSRYVVNDGSEAKKMYTAAFNESFPKSSSLTTTKTTKSSNEMGTGATIPVEIGTYFWNVKTEFSLSDVRRWENTTSSTETVTNNTSIDITEPPQEVIVHPRSKVNATTQVQSSIGPKIYFVDFRIDNFVSFFCETDIGFYFSFINMARFENEINSIEFDDDDAKLVCNNSECFLKDVPVMLEETEFRIRTYFGDEEPIEVQSKLAAFAKHNFSGNYLRPPTKIDFGHLLNLYSLLIISC